MSFYLFFKKFIIRPNVHFQTLRWKLSFFHIFFLNIANSIHRFLFDFTDKLTTYEKTRKYLRKIIIKVLIYRKYYVLYKINTNRLPCMTLWFGHPSIISLAIYCILFDLVFILTNKPKSLFLYKQKNNFIDRKFERLIGQT